MRTDDPAPLPLPVPSDLESRLQGRRLWVSGQRGFIGSRLVAIARGCRAEVFGLPGDVRDGVSEHISAVEPDLLVHMAAPVNVARDPSLVDLMRGVIVEGARLVRAATAELVHRRGRRVQLVLVGTCEEYGTIEAPYQEDASPSEPVSPYAAAKLEATREAMQAAPAAPFGLVVARPFLTYGPGQRSRQLVPAAIREALAGHRFPMTTGLQTRELNYVDDIAIGLLRAAVTPEAHGQIINIGSGDEHRVVDIVRRIFDLAGADPALIDAGALPSRAGEVARFYADVGKARRLLGHEAVVPLDEGLRRTIAWARQEEEREREG